MRFHKENLKDEIIKIEKDVHGGNKGFPENILLVGHQNLADSS